MNPFIRDPFAVLLADFEVVLMGLKRDRQADGSWSEIPNWEYTCSKLKKNHLSRLFTSNDNHDRNSYTTVLSHLPNPILMNFIIISAESSPQFSRVIGSMHDTVFPRLLKNQSRILYLVLIDSLAQRFESMSEVMRFLIEYGIREFGRCFYRLIYLTGTFRNRLRFVSKNIKIWKWIWESKLTKRDREECGRTLQWIHYTESFPSHRMDFH